MQRDETNFDERHCFAPRVDPTPGVLHVEQRLPLATWAAIIAVGALLLLALWLTDCGGAVWCS